MTRWFEFIIFLFFTSKVAKGLGFYGEMINLSRRGNMRVFVTCADVFFLFFDVYLSLEAEADQKRN